jgi:alpha-L-fucosidase
MLADIASKGGNFLLNVGPTAEGLFPQASVERLAVMGRWMKANGDAIHGTSASPFRSLPWGRCTQRATPEGATLYLHVFDWPLDGKLRVPGLFNQVRGAYLLADASRTPLAAVRQEDAVVVSLPPAAPDSLNSVVVLELKGKADVNDPPKIDTTYTVFIDQISVGVTTDRENVVIRYTTDGSTPTASSSVLTGPVTLKASSTVRARAFRGASPVSDASEARFTKVVPQPSVRAEVQPGLRYAYVEGDWDRLPDFSALAPKAEGVLPAPKLDLKREHEYYGVVFSGYINVPAEGVYAFFLASDDGSRMMVDGQLLIDNDGLHGLEQKRGVAALEKGLHPVRIEYFNKTGGEELSVFWTGPGLRMEAVPASAFFHR